MAFYKKVTIAVLLFIPLIAFAETEDVLMVSINYDTTKHQVLSVSIEQKVLDESNIFKNPKGQFKVYISKNGQQLSNNFFDVPTGEGFEAIGLNGQPDPNAKAPSIVSISVPLILTQDISVNDTSLIIEDSGLMKDDFQNPSKTAGNFGGIVFNKKLSDIPYEVSAVKKFSLTFTNESVFTAIAPDTKPVPGNIWLWIGLGIVGLGIVGIGAYRFIRKSKRQPPPPAPPTP